MPYFEDRIERLCALAGRYRACAGDLAQQKELVAEYLQVMAELEAGNWDGSLDFECMLPWRFMPASYLRRVGFL